jgi:hypothetical protein
MKNETKTKAEPQAKAATRIADHETNGGAL